MSFVLAGDGDRAGADRPSSTPVHLDTRRRHPAGGRRSPGVTPVLVLDEGEVRAVEMLARAGLVPGLRYELAG